ncbi:MAG: glycosyltransferase family protein [Deltaproteobacteria bacterium]
MAKILYGVHCTGDGHVTRALSIAREFPEHEFLFVCDTSKAHLIRPEFEVVEAPGLKTVTHANRVDLGATIGTNLRILSRGRQWVHMVLRLMEQFKPDAAIADLESWVQFASFRAGLPCLSLDHGHVLTLCDYPVPRAQRPRQMIDCMLIELFFSRASHYAITSFFRAPLKDNVRARIIPTVLRRNVRDREPSEGDHILAFHSFAGFEKIIPLLQNQSRPVIVYGYGEERREGNLCFKKRSVEGFLDDLASCCYLICGGGHTVVGEALFYGKPVLSFPGHYFEQYLSAFYVEHLGYGKFVKRARSNGEIIPSFEAGLDDFRTNIRGRRFWGTDEAVELVSRFVRHKEIEPDPAAG